MTQNCHGITFVFILRGEFLGFVSASETTGENLAGLF
jgi:hypothetical protein